jgi:hypothetical protein
MSYDYELGFREKPTNLGDVLRDMDFELQRTVGPNRDFPMEIQYYSAFRPGLSRRGVWIAYQDGIGSDTAEIWSAIAPGQVIKATAMVSIPWFYNEHDERMHEAAAYRLKETYNALLYDPQEGELL